MAEKTSAAITSAAICRPVQRRRSSGLGSARRRILTASQARTGTAASARIAGRRSGTSNSWERT
jgi:hypothetical protein